MKKTKIISFVFLVMFIMLLSLLFIPKTYAQGGVFDDGWTQENSMKYSITKENADVETSGYSEDGIPSNPFMLKMSDFDSDSLAYKISAYIVNDESVAGETLENGIVRLGLVPYYHDSNNWFVVYMNWDNSISSTSMANIHINGKKNGEWFDRDFWIHDNNNYIDYQVSSNGAFLMDVYCHGGYIYVQLGSREMIEFDLSDISFSTSSGSFMYGLYVYGTSATVDLFEVEDESILLNFQYHDGDTHLYSKHSRARFYDMAYISSNNISELDGFLGWSCSELSDELIKVGDNIALFDNYDKQNELIFYAVFDDGDVQSKEEIVDEVWSELTPVGQYSDKYFEIFYNGQNHGQLLGKSEVLNGLTADGAYSDKYNEIVNNTLSEVKANGLHSGTYNTIYYNGREQGHNDVLGNLTADGIYKDKYNEIYNTAYYNGREQGHNDVLGNLTADGIYKDKYNEIFALGEQNALDGVSVDGENSELYFDIYHFGHEQGRNKVLNNLTPSGEYSDKYNEIYDEAYDEGYDDGYNVASDEVTDEMTNREDTDKGTIVVSAVLGLSLLTLIVVVVLKIKNSVKRRKFR